MLCNECNKVFKSERSLYAHKKEKHLSAPEVHLCPECGAGFGRKSNMRAHMRVNCKVGRMRPKEPKPPLTHLHDHQNLADSDTASDMKSGTLQLVLKQQGLIAFIINEGWILVRRKEYIDVFIEGQPFNSVEVLFQVKTKVRHVLLVRMFLSE